MPSPRATSKPPPSCCLWSTTSCAASPRLAHEGPGQTLQPTALVHEAYLRLVGTHDERRWNSRGHFFGAAAEAMRRILVESARRKLGGKHGGALQRQDLEEHNVPVA